MKITKIKIKNFKALNGEHEINLETPIVSLIGENNTGKTTLFSAIDFLKNGLGKDKKIEDYKNKNAESDNVSVEAIIKGNLKDVIGKFSEDKFLPYVYEENGIETIRLKRSSEKIIIKQNKKDVELDEKKITVFNQEAQQFENPTGFDKAISSFFDAQFVWSDMQSGDVVDFGSTKILGKLLKEISGEFKESEEWQLFLNAHDKAFKTGDNALSKKSSSIVNDIERSLAEFYGKASIQFDFRPPEPESFVKLGDLLVDDGVSTSITEKGSGMQRALALSVIKVYADYLSRHKDDIKIKKPIFLFIDEPEISLHPKAQAILANALNEISKFQQVFISTHSPHFLKGFASQKNAIQIFTKNGSSISITPATRMSTFTFSPTIAEINHFAYQLSTIDFHNELYGYIIEKTQNFTTKSLDQWFNQQHQIQLSKQWIRIKGGLPQSPENVTPETYIRNKIHHPENIHNLEFTETELELSIRQMLTIIPAIP